ncbi:cytochrome-c oxidase [Uruburuella testudinis]|uniref:Cytochrome-c oxidase n=1 Tax=Uruburuella testudinis TaxID=1282863 RepID=A0ABY4DTZ5_9NEIS|nr:cytochrome-c oxidase [Uruburuella testudinis]UOO81898.1 cytochrome-c oxidase [Uruburuella testudinis]
MAEQNKPDLSKMKPQPYESFEEAEQARENDAVAVNAPLTERQRAIVREQSGINPVTQTVTDVLKDKPDLPQADDDTDKDAP